MASSEWTPGGRETRLDALTHASWTDRCSATSSGSSSSLSPLFPSSSSSSPSRSSSRRSMRSTLAVARCSSYWIRGVQAAANSCSRIGPAPLLPTRPRCAPFSDAPSTAGSDTGSCCNGPPKMQEADVTDPATAVTSRLQAMEGDLLQLQRRLESDIGDSHSDQREAHERVESVRKLRHQVEYMQELMRISSKRGSQQPATDQ